MAYRSAKRALDFTVAFAAIVVLSPVMLVVSLAVCMSSPGGVLFAQERVGRGESPFRIFKFRTMRVGIPGADVTTAGDPRVTPIGRWLRRYKLDELPQLLNIVRGEMSIVGPRPELRKYVNLYRDPYRTILLVRPGLTDFASLTFHDEEKVLATSVDPDRLYVEEILPRKIELNLRYVKEMSLATDLRLIARTVAVLFR